MFEQMKAFFKKQLLTVRTKSTLRQKAISWFFGFLAVMVACTVLSRVAQTATIAQVTVAMPVKQKMTKSVKGEGTATFDKKETVTILTDLLIESIAVSEGTAVKKGDLLIQMDMENLNGKISELQKEIDGLQKQLNQLSDSKKQAQADAAKAVKRAKEDYNTTQKRTAKAVEDARKKLEDAKNAYENYSPELDEDGMEIGPSKQELLATYELAQDAYQLAVYTQEDELKRAKREVEDASGNTSPAGDDTGADLQEQRDKKQEEIKKYTDLRDNEGQILSPEDGIIMKILVQPGEPAADKNAVVIGVDGNSNILTAQFPKDAKKYLNEQAKATVTLDNGTIIEQVALTSISQADDGESYTVTMRIPDGVMEANQTAEVEIIYKAKTYPVCVPLEALHSESNNVNYVLVVGEKETILGTELVAQRIDVSVQDKDSKYAAVEGIWERQEFIVDSTRPLKNGDRVRLPS